MIIESTRLYCRKFTWDDLIGFHGLNGSEEVMKYIRPVTSFEQSTVKLRTTIEEYETKPELMRWALVKKGTDDFVGCFVIFPLEARPGTMQLGYSLLPAYWGRGFATEITAAGLSYAKNVLKLEVIYAVTHWEHQVSQQVLLKNGFVFDTEFREMEERLYLYKYNFNNQPGI